MSNRNIARGNGHNFIEALFRKTADCCRKILRKLKYVVPDELVCENWWKVKLFFSFTLPVAAALFSIIFLTIEPLYFAAIIISVGYKTLMVLLEYNNYKNNGTGQRTSGVRPENPVLIRLVAIIAAWVFVTIVVVVHIFWPGDVTMQGVVIIFGLLDLVITCSLDTCDALVALFLAELPFFD